MTLNDLQALLSKLDYDDEMENWMINVINSRIENNDYELEELLECDNEDEAYDLLEEQYMELQPDEDEDGDDN